MNKDWIELPAAGYAGTVPDFPLPAVPLYETYFADGQKVRELDEAASVEFRDLETDLWADLWRKPQAAAWDSLGLKFQVAAYTRAFLESVKADAVAGLKTTVLRMETELGLSIAGMRQNGWRIADGTAVAPAVNAAAAKAAARRTSSGDWLTGVTVDRE
jgi:hypothetical protein